jgi:hypothetical protein
MHNASSFFARPVFVTGRPRSGTSLSAGLLDTLGVWTGRTIPGGPANPKGFFENEAIRETLIKPVLKQGRYDPLGVRIIPPETYAPVIRSARGENLVELLHRMITAQGYSEDRPWLYKDAKLALVWRSFSRAFPDASWIIVRRDTESFVSSCLRTSFMRQLSEDPAFWKAYAESMDQRLAALATNVSHCFELSANRLVEGDFTELEPICRHVGLTYNQDALVDFVEPKFWRAK